MTMEAIANVLNTTVKNVEARARAMKLTPVCGRCLGSGQYSFNGTHSRCYGCGGAGCLSIKPSDIPAVLERAQEAALNGELDRYIAFLNARKIANDANKTVMAAWTATQVAALNGGISHMIRDNEIEGLADLRAANRIMYLAVNKVGNVYLDARKPSYRDDVIALAAMVETSVAAIWDAERNYTATQTIIDASIAGYRKMEDARKKRFG